MATVAQRKHCLYCKRDLTLHEQHAGGVCSTSACRLKLIQSRAAVLERNLQRDLQRDLTSFRARAAHAVHDETWESVAIAVIAHRKERVVSLDTEQRSAFEAHLRAVALTVANSADEAHVDGDDDADQLGQELAVSRVASRVCSACSGFCCYPGKDRMAFIETQTLQRYARAHPGVKPEDMVADYLARVPQRHFEGSCVYHTAFGCNLPRSMRSATCNGYMCSGLKSALEAKVDDPSERRFVVARDRNQIVRGVLIDESGSREVLNCTEQTSDTAIDRSS